MYKKILLITIALFVQNSFAQLIIQEDSLLNKPFEYLENHIKDNTIEQSQKNIYIDAYLNKAKKEKDTVNIGHGFFYKTTENSYHSDGNFYSAIVNQKNNKKGIIYSDSIIHYTKKINDKTYPGLGYILRGFFYYNLSNEKKALSDYLTAQKYAQKHSNKRQLSQIKEVVKTIKNDGYSNINDAKREFDSLANKENNEKVDIYSYLSALKNYVSELQREKDYILAERYINEGILKSTNLGLNDLNYYNSFVFSSGINYYFKKEYSRALDSINKAEPKLGINSLSLAYYLKGEIYKTQDTVKATHYFNKVDSIFQINHTNIYGLFNNYKSLIAIHKANNSYTKQIENIDKLIYADSIVNANKIYYEEKILNEYEIPKYKFEKEKIILELKEKNKNRKQDVLYLFVIVVLAFITAFYFFRKQVVYKKRFNQLLLEQKPIDKPVLVEKKTTKELDISKENISNILSGLTIFEIELGYLDNTINLSKLSKKINTNSSYLSKVINNIKKKSFSKYLNDLRIDYIIKELKNNSILRKHTIHAIAEEIGFNNSESFSKAFYKKTGIYPSYFIRQLNKDAL